MGLIMQNGISYGGVDIVKLTQAEYDALPESKYTDGILYAITDGESSSGGGSSKPVELTKAQYEALGESTKTDGILYAITDGDELSAKNLEYDGSQTGLGNNVQDAIDELNSNITDIQKRINNISFIVDENGDWCFLPDGSTIPIKLTEYREKKEYTATGTRSGDVNGTVFNYAISFGCEFVAPPIVTVKFTTNEDSKFTSCSATNVTTTGFTLHMTKTSTSNERKFAVSWRATGYVYVS